MALLFWIGIFIISLIVLVKASDYFTGSAEKIGLRFGMPAFIVGVTIAAIGTSLPELVSSIVAVIQGSSEIVIGNVVGSNIANIFFVLGIAAIIGKRLKISFNLLHVDLPLLATSALLLAVTIWDGVFTLPEAFLCIAGYIIYILYTLKDGKSGESEIVKEIKTEAKKKEKKLSPLVWIILIISSFFIFLGAKFTVDSIIEISQIINIGTEIIAVSAVALGTSLPELMVTISAARRGNPALAVGNVLGSSIFNALAVTGIAALFGTLIIPTTILSFSLPMMLIAIFLYFVMIQDKEITQWEGWTLILFYVFFLGKTFALF